MKRLRPAGGPRSRRTREALAMEATGWSRSEVHTQILKGLYPMFGTAKPAWAELAKKRGWMTLAAFLQVPSIRLPSLPGPLAYVTSPFFKLLKKETSFGNKGTSKGTVKP